MIAPVKLIFENVAVASAQIFINNGLGSLSDLGSRSENSAGREQILSILKVNSRSIDRKSGEI
jgi:hypothetical protein